MTTAESLHKIRVFPEQNLQDDSGAKPNVQLLGNNIKISQSKKILRKFFAIFRIFCIYLHFCRSYQRKNY